MSWPHPGIFTTNVYIETSLISYRKLRSGVLGSWCRLALACTAVMDEALPHFVGREGLTA